MPFFESYEIVCFAYKEIYEKLFTKQTFCYILREKERRDGEERVLRNYGNRFEVVLRFL